MKKVTRRQNSSLVEGPHLSSCPICSSVPKTASAFFPPSEALWVQSPSCGRVRNFGSPFRALSTAGRKEQSRRGCPVSKESLARDLPGSPRGIAAGRVLWNLSAEVTRCSAPSTGTAARAAALRSGVHTRNGGGCFCPPWLNTSRTPLPGASQPASGQLLSKSLPVTLEVPSKSPKASFVIPPTRVLTSHRPKHKSQMR